MLGALEHARDDAVSEGPESRKPLPPWLKWSLVILIITNILAYVIVTWMSLLELDEQISELAATNKSSAQQRSLPFNSLPPNFTESGLLGLSSDNGITNADQVKVLQWRKKKLIIELAIEVVIDLVDLVDVFLGSYLLHVMYMITKLFSIGMWSYSQVDLRHSAIWLIPLAICLIIIIILLRWFTALRKWVLALCIIISTISWLSILVIRVHQINSQIDYLENLPSGADEKNTDKLIAEQYSNRIQIIVGALLMIIFGSMGLVAEWLRCLWTGIAFGILHAIGFTLWILKISLDHGSGDILFVVPLIYSILIFAIFLIYLFMLFHRAKRIHEAMQQKMREMVNHPPSNKSQRPTKRLQLYKTDQTKGQMKSRKYLR